MATKSRSRSQVKKDRSALRKLKSTGLLKGRIDLRKSPSPSQKRAIKRYADVISGKAKVLKPKNPRRYRKLFKVSGDRVIVPRRKGERVWIGSKGEIKSIRKIGDRKIEGEYKKISDLVSTSEQKIYLLPVQRRANSLWWYKFESREALEQFVFETSPKIGATYKNYGNYVLEMNLGEYNVSSDNEFEDKLYRQLARRRRARKRRK